MNHTVRIKGRNLRMAVYFSRLYLRRILHPKDGDVGYAMIGDHKEVTLIWNDKFKMWCLPGFALEIMLPPSPLGGRLSA